MPSQIVDGGATSSLQRCPRRGTSVATAGGAVAPIERTVRS
jgi:hypothetical protein